MVNLTLDHFPDIRTHYMHLVNHMWEKHQIPNVKMFVPVPRQAPRAKSQLKRTMDPEAWEKGNVRGSGVWFVPTFYVEEAFLQVLAVHSWQHEWTDSQMGTLLDLTGGKSLWMTVLNFWTFAWGGGSQFVKCLPHVEAMNIAIGLCSIFIIVYILALSSS